MAFFQACWDVIKADIMRVFQDFHASNKFGKKSFNASIAIIPKKSGAIDRKDFRPIRLVSIVYKIISEVLANRLKRLCRRLIRSPRMLLFKVGKSLIMFL